jgi:hypothetical protein
MVAKSKPQREARIKKLLENGQDRAWQKEQREVFLDAIASVCRRIRPLRVNI